MKTATNSNVSEPAQKKQVGAGTPQVGNMEEKAPCHFWCCARWHL